MEKLTEYVTHAFRGVPKSERKTQLIQEIVQDLEEKVQDLISQGKTEEDAVNKALIDFGDFDDIRQELLGAQPLEPPRRRPGIALGFSLCGSALIIILALFINFYYTPGHIWFVYPTIGVLWWPLVMFFRWLRLK